MVLDTACVNAEANLASELATFMARPREAKRLLQNFFSAPGDLRIAANYIEVVLDAGQKQGSSTSGASSPERY